MQTTKTPWIARRLWDGGDCYILGGGPGLWGLDLRPLLDRRVIAVNNAFKLGPWDVLFYGDCGWYRRYHKELRSWAGLKVTTCLQHENQPGIFVMNRRNSPRGICTNRSRLAWNLSSGTCAINLAYHFGARRIILLGFDMRKIDGRANWHEEHHVNKNPNHNPYKRFLDPMNEVARDLKKLNVECINATPGSAMTQFPIVDPAEFGLKRDPNLKEAVPVTVPVLPTDDEVGT